MQKKVFYSILKKILPTKKHYSSRIWFAIFVPSLFFVSIVNSQESLSVRVPQYTIPYTFPSVDSIQILLKRVKNFYQSTSERAIVNSKTGEKITNFTINNPLATVSEGFSGEWSYTNGVVLSAFDYITKVTGDTSFCNDNIRFYDFVVNGIPYFQKTFGIAYDKKIGTWGRILNFEALDDCGSIGAALIKTYQKHKNKNYLDLINRIADFVSNKQFRLSDGTLARHRPQYESVWADDLYMGVPFLANMGVLTGNNSYFDDAAKQFLQMSDKLFVPQKELFDHGWNANTATYDPHFYWGRANGWALMTMVELLSVLPEKHPARERILHLYRSLIRSLAGLQDGTGFWHNMVDKTDTFLETSCTAMFTYAVAKGINEGWISHTYGPVALTGWNALATRVLANGAVDGTCEATTFASDNTYYYNRGKSIYATHGYGPMLYAGIEMIRLLKNDKIEIQKASNGSINSTYHFILKTEWPKK